MHIGVLEWDAIWCPLDGRFGLQQKKELKIGNHNPTDTIELGEYEGNSKALNAILSVLKNSVFTKFMQCTSSKQACDKLKIIYEGESKVKESKLQTYRGQF